MNDDYLWDKSGEPDPQIKQLEDILAPLRYQPKPLELPRKRNYFPLLAIAATVLLAVLITGVWLRVREEKVVQPQQAKTAPSVYKEKVVVENTDLPKKPVPRRVPRRTFTNRERQEALAAKQQLMLALRLASEKLKLAHKKTQGASPNQIKNQHRVG